MVGEMSEEGIQRVVLGVTDHFLLKKDDFFLWLNIYLITS